MRLLCGVSTHPGSRLQRKVGLKWSQSHKKDCLLSATQVCFKNYRCRVFGRRENQGSFLCFSAPGTRMGGGKASIHHYVTPVKAGRIIIELAGHIEFEEVRQKMPFVGAVCERGYLHYLAINLEIKKDIHCNLSLMFALPSLEVDQKSTATLTTRQFYLTQPLHQNPSDKSWYNLLHLGRTNYLFTRTNVASSRTAPLTALNFARALQWDRPAPPSTPRVYSSLRYTFL